MNVIVEVHDQVCKVYAQYLLQEIAQKTIELSDAVSSNVKVIQISVAIVSESEICGINNQFRNKDAVTDVISVGDYSDDNSLKHESQKEIFLGEVVLCYNYIAETASLTKISVDEEFFTVYAHGILHLLGFKHGAEMFELQEKIAKMFVK